MGYTEKYLSKLAAVSAGHSADEIVAAMPPGSLPGIDSPDMRRLIVELYLHDKTCGSEQLDYLARTLTTVPLSQGTVEAMAKVAALPSDTDRRIVGQHYQALSERIGGRDRASGRDLPTFITECPTYDSPQAMISYLLHYRELVENSRAADAVRHWCFQIDSAIDRLRNRIQATGI